MSEETDREILDTLREIRDRQREIISSLAAQRALAEEQIKRSRQSIEESVGLQREALWRQRSITGIAVPGILACIARVPGLAILLGATDGSGGGPGRDPASGARLRRERHGSSCDRDGNERGAGFLAPDRAFHDAPARL